MSSIKCHQAGKRYHRDWIFRQCTVSLQEGISYAVLGPNGSGKSTWLKALSGYLTLTEGVIDWTVGAIKVPAEDIHRHVSMVAPYLELVEELTVAEAIEFHFRFKQWLPGWQQDRLMERLSFQAHGNKAIRDLSSGMRQRMKLALALASDTAIVLLDEPATNLDAAGVTWYHELVAETKGTRLIVVASNRTDEYSFCTEHLSMADWKL